MSASSAQTLHAAWLDLQDPGSPAQASALQGLGLTAHRVDSLADLVHALPGVQLVVLRLDDDLELLGHCLDFTRSTGRHLPIICRVPRRDIGLAVAAMRAGASHAVPLDEWDSAAWLPGLLAPDAPRPVKAPRSVIFVDPASRQLLLLAQRVAQAGVTALLTGPTGAGKEVLARVLHEASSRAAGPFVSLNCGALPEHLIEDMLFGHEKGAFSGAIRDHRGVFEQADGGTVFLDEIGEMPIHLQTRLLRVLQERCITRLGGTRSIPIDVRVVAATNRDLKAAMQQREFREDLYFRISTFGLRVPPLRDRPRDIVPLASHFLAQHRLSSSCPVLSQESQTRLLAYPWPGNVRELENVIHRALVLCTGPVIEPVHLLFDDGLFSADAPGSSADAPSPAQEAAAARAQDLASELPPPALHEPRREPDDLLTQPVQTEPTDSGQLPSGLHGAVRQSEWQVINEAIRKTTSREAAARLLGISPRTLRYKLAQLRGVGMTAAQALT